MRSSCLNNFRDVYYYQKSVSAFGDETHIQMNVGYNRTGTFGTGSSQPFEYEVAHQHYTRLLTPAEMYKTHLANISNTTNLSGCELESATCQEFRFNAGPDFQATASYELCGSGTTTTEVLPSGSSITVCLTSGSAKSLAGTGGNIQFIQFCNS